MDDLQELYQELIVDHSKRPRNARKPEGSNYHAEGYNPLCGDRLTLYLKVEDGVIKDVGFEGKGCAISTASASLMSEALKGQPVEQAKVIFETFHYMLTGPRDPQNAGKDLGKLAVFSGVRDFPTRVKCATLAWHTLKSALENKDEVVSTE